jgi:hypothetical protein
MQLNYIFGRLISVFRGLLLTLITVGHHRYLKYQCSQITSYADHTHADLNCWLYIDHKTRGGLDQMIMQAAIVYLYCGHFLGSFSHSLVN